MTSAPQGLRGYLAVLTHGHAVRPFAASVLARLPISMTGLGIIIVLEGVRGAYTMAGIVTACFALSTAASAPVWGRLMDRHGQPRVLIPISVVSAASLVMLSVGAVALWADGLLIALAICCGLSFPPISAAMRTSWRVIYPAGAARRQGFALDASSVELIFVLGPLLLSALAAWTPPQVPLIVTASALAVGTVSYCLTAAARTRPVREAGENGQPPRSRTRRTAITAPGLLALLAVSATMAIGFGHLDTSIVAAADQALGASDRMGFLFAAIAGGSTLGGLAYGSRHWGGDENKRMALVLYAFALTLVPLPLILLSSKPSLWLLLPLLFVTGVTIAPTLIMFQNAIDHLAPHDKMTEAQSFLTASQTSGGALGMAIAGILIDHFRATGGFTGAIVAVTIGATIAAANIGYWRRIATRSDRFG